MASEVQRSGRSRSPTYGGAVPTSGSDTRGWPVFLFHFNKLGVLGSIMVSVTLTVVLIVAFRLIRG